MKLHTRIGLIVAVALAFVTVTAGAALAQGQGDLDAINRFIDRYGALEDAMDMTAQGAMIADDRVWIAQGAGRRTDQAMNMRIQQAGFDAFKEAVPGVRAFTEDRDRLIKFYGNNTVAVASFYRYTTFVVPADAAAPNPPPNAVTLVLEKRGSEWKIVHSHFSSLGPAPN